MTRSLTAEALADDISRLARDHATTLLVAIDGRSGAGKSALAAQLAGALEASVVPADDFFAASITDTEWDALTPAQRASECLDWRRLRAEALEPLKAGRLAAWRALDFAGGRRADGSYGLRSAVSTRPPSAIVLVDGAYSTRPELADLVDLSVLVEAPEDVRARRLARREEPGFLARWQARWGAAEDHYFTAVRPRATFDVVIAGE